MNYNNFLNKQIITKDNNLGIVISFDNEHIVIKLNNLIKTYNPDIAFKTKYLTFKNPKYQKLIDIDLIEKDIAIAKSKQEIEEIRKQHFHRLKSINQTYRRMFIKARKLKMLFGGDYDYQ